MTARARATTSNRNLTCYGDDTVPAFNPVTVAWAMSRRPGAAMMLRLVPKCRDGLGGLAAGRQQWLEVVACTGITTAQQRLPTAAKRSRGVAARACRQRLGSNGVGRVMFAEFGGRAHRLRHIQRIIAFTTISVELRIRVNKLN